MTYIEGDYVAPSEFVIPIVSGAATLQPNISGAFYISGSEAFIVMPSGLYVLTGALA